MRFIYAKTPKEVKLNIYNIMGKILEVRTEHVLPFKMLVEVLKEILNDVTIEAIRDDAMNKIAQSSDDDSDAQSDDDFEESSEDDKQKKNTLRNGKKKLVLSKKKKKG
jgi:rubrerythrin